MPTNNKDNPQKDTIIYNSITPDSYFKYGCRFFITLSSIDSPIFNNPRTILAQIDEGATFSMIDSQLATELSLKPLKRYEAPLELNLDHKITLSGVTGKTDHDLYVGKIALCPLNNEEEHKFVSANLRKGQQPEVFLGRSFLQNKSFFYNPYICMYGIIIRN